MKLTLYTKEDMYELGKAIVKNVTGVNYPFGKRTLHRAYVQLAAYFGASTSGNILRLVQSTVLDGISKTLLDRKGLESGVARLDKAPARGRGRAKPIVSPAGADYTVPAGTVVMRPATGTQSELAFKLEAAATIPNGATQSNLVSIVAETTGIAHNDVPSGTNLELKYPISGVLHFSLETDTGGGLSIQSDSDYKDAIRGAKKSRAEGSWSGIENLVKTVKLDTGARVTTAKLFEDFTNYQQSLYIDDGSGDSSIVGPVDSTTYPFGGGAGTYWEYVASGSEIYIQLPYYHLPGWSDGVTEELDLWNGAAWVGQTYNTDYYVNIDTGMIAMAVPLTAGEKIRAHFRFYTGLVGEVARYVNGVRGSSEIKGWRSIGVPIRIRGPVSVVKPSVSCTLHFDSGYDSIYGRSLAAERVLTYLQSLDIGQPARYNVIAGIVLKVPGASYVDDLLLSSGVIDVPPSSAYGVVRGDSTTIVI